MHGENMKIVIKYLSAHQLPSLVCVSSVALFSFCRILPDDEFLKWGAKCRGCNICLVHNKLLCCSILINIHVYESISATHCHVWDT